MNYIELINNFWSYTEEEDISSSDTSVYFALLKYNNSLNWISSFRCDYGVICQYSRVSKNTFYKSLKSLEDLGLISYEKGVRNLMKPKVSILNLKNRKGTVKEQNGNSEGIEEEQNEEQNEEQKGNLYKLLNKETIKLINSNATLVNSNIKKWIESEKEEVKGKLCLGAFDNISIEKEKEKDLVEKYGPDAFGWMINKLGAWLVTKKKTVKSARSLQAYFENWVLKAFNEQKEKSKNGKHNQITIEEGAERFLHAYRNEASSNGQSAEHLPDIFNLGELGG